MKFALLTLLTIVGFQVNAKSFDPSAVSYTDPDKIYLYSVAIRQALAQGIREKSLVCTPSKDGAALRQNLAPEKILAVVVQSDAIIFNLAAGDAKDFKTWIRFDVFNTEILSAQLSHEQMMDVNTGTLLEPKLNRQWADLDNLDICNLPNR